MIRTNEIRMLKGVERRYLAKRSDLTTIIGIARLDGMLAYRTPLVCECNDNCNVRQSGAVVVDEKTGQVLYYLIRCKACYRERGVKL